MIKPKVSICMIVYNHGNYLEDAINGVLMQQTTFEYEFVVSNDKSSDNSDEIISRLTRNIESIKIKYFNHTKNKGMMDNFIFTLKKCSGKYIALCEGDDYWTDSLKLQKQVDFLENNLDYNICFHRVNILDQHTGNILNDTITRDVPETTTMFDLANGNYIHTPSVVLRNNFNLPYWLKKATLGDWTLYVITVKDKKIKKINETMAVYRKHDSSIWSGNTEYNRLVALKQTYTLAYKNLSLKKEDKQQLKKQIIKYRKAINAKKFKFLHLPKRVWRKIKKMIG